MIAYLLFCILCVLLIPFTGGLAAWLWLIVTGLWLVMAVAGELFRAGYKVWDKAMSDDEV